MVHEEKGITPFVSVETFDGGGDVLTILCEIVEHLNVGLGLGHREGRECNAQGKNSFFHKT